MVNQATVRPASTAAWPRASQKWRLAGAGGAADAQVLPAVRPIPGCAARAGSVRGIEEACSVPGVEGLAGGERGALAAGAQGGRVPAGGLLGEQDPDDLGGVPALRFGGGRRPRRMARRMCGSFSRRVSSIGLGRAGPPAGAGDTAGGVGSGVVPVTRRSRFGLGGAERGPGGGAGLQAVGSRWRRAGSVVVAGAGGRGSRSGRSRRTGRRARRCPSARSTRPRAVQLGQRDGLGHLAPDPRAPRRRRPRPASGRAPAPRARNAASSAVRGPRRPFAGARGWRGRRVVLVADRGLPGVGARVAGDLGRAAVGVDDGDDRVRRRGTRTQTRASTSWCGHRVRARPRTQIGGVPVHPPGRAERDRERLRPERVQPGLFLGEHLDRCPAGLPVQPGVDLVAELPTGRLQLGRTMRYSSQQVRLGRHQIGLCDPHRRLRPALGLRVRRHAGADRHPVVPARRPRSAGCRTATPATCSTVTVFSLSVSAYVGTPPSRRSVASRQATIVGSVLSQHRRSRPGTATRPATRTQHRPPAADRAGPSPQSHCSHSPGSVTHGRNTRRCPARKPRLHLGHRPAGRALPAGEPHRRPAARAPRRRGPCPFERATNSSILSRYVVDRPGPVLPADRRLPRLPQLHIPGHRVVVTPGQLGRRPVTAREVVRLQNLHDLLAPLHRPTISTVTSLDHRGDIWPSTGRSLAITGAVNGRLRGVWTGR